MFANKWATQKINSKSDITDSVNRCWQQTHDANGTDFTGYTPIAGNYKSTTKDSYVVPLYTWFGGSYDGQSYKIQNLNITSSSFAVGVFGVTVGANMKNIILYVKIVFLIPQELLILLKKILLQQLLHSNHVPFV